MASTEVLIVGAGPTGLVLALWLTKLGVKIRIIDRTADGRRLTREQAIHAAGNSVSPPPYLRILEVNLDPIEPEAMRLAA